MSNQELIDKLTQIILDSDDRMRITNDMVNRLTETLNVITKEYSKQLTSLKQCRDNQVEIIKNQQKIIETQHQELVDERQRNRDLIDKIILRSSVQVTQS